MKVTIFCGIPGSGKTTTARQMFPPDPTTVMCSADHYMMEEGVFRYDKLKLQEAHRKCLNKFLLSLGNAKNVVVDNTNIQVWELAAYYQAAEAFGVAVEIITIYCDPVVAFQRNTHNVPLKAILSMHHNLHSRFLPPWWKETVILAG